MNTTERRLLPPAASTKTAWVALAFVPFLILGCAGHDHYVRGETYVEQDNPEQAVGEFQKATELEPDNARYQTALADAQSAAADLHYQQAEQRVAESNLPEARNELRRALELSPGHPNATTLMNRLGTEAASQSMASSSPPQSPATAPSVALPESKAGQGLGTPPVVARDMRKMPSARPGGAEPAPRTGEPVPPPDAVAAAQRVETRPADDDKAAPQFAPGSFPATLSRDDHTYPKQIDTLDEITVHLKNVKKKPLRADIEVRVDKLVKRYRELRVGARISGRGDSRRPYEITILEIEPESETVTLVVEPLIHLPAR